MSLRGKKIAVGGMELNVVVRGTGPPVLLLHGFPDSAYVWRAQIPFLVRQGFKVIAPDSRGMGDSPAPAGRACYTMDKIAADTVGLLDRLGIERAAVVGHDWGAVLGWELAMFHSGRVERFAALSVGHPVEYRSDPAQLRKAWYTAWFQVPGLSEWSMRAGGWRMTRALGGGHAEARHWIEDLSRPGRLTAGMNWYRANARRMLFGKFPDVHVPVMGVWSGKDAFLTEGQMKGSARRVYAPFRYERIEGAGHWMQQDAPDRVNELLLGFLRGGV